MPPAIPPAPFPSLTTQGTSRKRGGSVGTIALFLLISAVLPPTLPAQDEEADPFWTPGSGEGKEIPQPAHASSGKDVLSSEKQVLIESNAKGPSQAELDTGRFSRTPFHISVAVREGYDDNVYTAKVNPVGSWFINSSVVLDYHFGNPRTKFDLQAMGGLTYFYHRPFGQEDDVNSGLTIAFSHQFTPRLGLAASARLTYQSEPDFAAGIGLNRRSGNYLYTSDRVSLSSAWTPRLSSVMSYTLGAVHYDDSIIGGYEDRVEQTFGNEFRILWLPTTTLVGEYRFQTIDYDNAANDSRTHFALAGIEQTFNPRFNLSLRGGAEFREFENFSRRMSPYGEATLNYALGRRTRLGWSNRYGLEAPDVPGTPLRTTFRTGLTLAYGLTRRVTPSLSFYYEHDEYDGAATRIVLIPAFDEESLDLAIAVRYNISNTVAAFAGYSHTDILSDVFLREYARNRYYIGLNAAF